MESLIYGKDGIDSSLIVRFANARKHLIEPCARGLTSLIYRIPDDQESENIGVYCIKRVAEEDEVRPHSIQRELLCYQLINEERAKVPNGTVPIVSLLAAFRDESDPFSVEVDLIMPFYPCTLEDLLDEPLLQFSSANDNHSIVALSQPRPSLTIAKDIVSLSIETFIQSTTQSLFSVLSFLHRCHIAHRDIKPSNILVDSKTFEIVLIDFGTCHLPSFRPGDDGKGGMTSEVGTGGYRAPESLFSPLNGYSAEKVDIWQAGVTLLQFFLPLRKVSMIKPKSARLQEDENRDERQEWEKALWADDAGLSWSQLGEPSTSTPNFDTEQEAEVSPSGWKRRMLFEGTRGDIGLANSIFELRGLPESPLEWPEAEFFQPNLQRMPFPRRPPALGGLQQRLTQDVPIKLQPIINILDQCIQLSSTKRISADDAIKQL